MLTYYVGSTRVMNFKTKKDVVAKKIIKVKLFHNSLFVLGAQTNKLFTHSIKQDKRF